MIYTRVSLNVAYQASDPGTLPQKLLFCKMFAWWNSKVIRILFTTIAITLGTLFWIDKVYDFIKVGSTGLQASLKKRGVFHWQGNEEV